MLILRFILETGFERQNGHWDHLVRKENLIPKKLASPCTAGGVSWALPRLLRKPSETQAGSSKNTLPLLTP